MILGGILWVWGGQVTFPGVGKVGLLVAPALVFSPALAAAVDVEGLAQQAGQGVGGHGVAVFAPFVPGTVVQAEQVIQDFGGEDAFRVTVVGEGVADVGEQVHGGRFAVVL